MTHQVKDAVVLIPGFLGFERIGHFSYFADRVGAALRSGLMGASKQNIPVFPIKTCPTDCLANRQIALLQTLQRLERHFEHIERFHLVGHSTGGVDAYLLTRKTPLQAESTWSDVDPHQTRHKIKTVISIASPHMGTCLALSPLARFFQRPAGAFFNGPSMGLMLGRLALCLIGDEMAQGAAMGAVTDAGSAAAYMVSVVRSNTLITNLRPQYLVPLYTHFEQDLDVLVRSVVTMAGQESPQYRFAGRPPLMRRPDAFFEGMYQHAAGTGYDNVCDDYERLDAALALIQSSLTGPKLIKNQQTALRELTPMLNDGLVNSARQLVDPHNPEELLAIVVGDHIDVMGYYPRWALTAHVDDQAQDTQLQSGILHSGSGFGDEEFFTLFDNIARVIAARIESCEQQSIWGK